MALALLAIPVAAQPARIALTDFAQVCEADADHVTTVRGFAQRGWTEAPAQLGKLFAQDLIKPSDDIRLVRMLSGGGMLLAAAMAEDTGTLGTRQKTVCFVRLFVDQPLDIRDAFRQAMRIRPSKSVENDTVIADIWSRAVTGRLVGLRAVQLPDKSWMVTAYRVLANG